jgi:hypothetical protein
MVGFLSLPVALALNDQLERGGLEAVDRGLGQQRVGHHGQDLGWFPVGGDDRGGVLVAFHDQLIEVVGLQRIQRMEGQVVEDEQFDPVEFADLFVVGVVQPGGFESFEQFVGAFGVHAVAAADCGVAQSVGEERFPDADWSHDQDVVGVQDEPQRGQLGPQLPVETHLVIYESRLELARLLFADFDASVRHIVAQPFLLKAEVAGAMHKHIPDYLLATDTGPLVVDVKPQHRATTRRDAR